MGLLKRIRSIAKPIGLLLTAVCIALITVAVHAQNAELPESLKPCLPSDLQYRTVWGQVEMGVQRYWWIGSGRVPLLEDTYGNLGYEQRVVLESSNACQIVITDEEMFKKNNDNLASYMPQEVAEQLWDQRLAIMIQMYGGLEQFKRRYVSELRSPDEPGVSPPNIDEIAIPPEMVAALKRAGIELDFEDLQITPSPPRPKRDLTGDPSLQEN